MSCIYQCKIETLKIDGPNKETMGPTSIPNALPPWCRVVLVLGTLALLGPLIKGTLYSQLWLV